jgi:hypothetical protein
VTGGRAVGSTATVICSTTSHEAMHIATPGCEADEMSLFSKQYHGIRRRDGLWQL